MRDRQGQVAVPGIGSSELELQEKERKSQSCVELPKGLLCRGGSGVNFRGLSSCEVWQTDVTHTSQFGRLKYMHVSVNTFSGAVYASAHIGQKAADAQKYLVQAFSMLGIPKVIKIDNGSTYASKAFDKFLQQWGVEDKKGYPIPKNTDVHLITPGNLRPSLEAWIVPQPRKNVWVTMSSALKQDHLRMPMAAVENPLSTCLVATPKRQCDEEKNKHIDSNTGVKNILMG
ncbi:hypothetical protein HGM15179_000663 [Zosterops borbonicus]|uniref:Integrase catalytic domain-containing protein n=1 Tax=Zosterops borbonicus TaxID=364589 RepID=A0A8K1LUK3_9PASS|nr:hypothetical protein HGM15179_000663 [Zosterops borbonicus]